MQPHNLSPPPANLSPPNTFLRTSHLQGGSRLNFRALFSIALPWREIIYCCAERTGDAERCCAGRVVLQPGRAGGFRAAGGGSKRGLQCLGTWTGKKEECPARTAAWLAAAAGTRMPTEKHKQLLHCHHARSAPEGLGVGCPALRSASMGWQSHLWSLSSELVFHSWYSYSLQSGKKGCLLPLGNAIQHRCNSPKHGSSIASDCNIWDYCYKILKDVLF